jgi:hypothetical protein
MSAERARIGTTKGKRELYRSKVPVHTRTAYAATILSA